MPRLLLLLGLTMAVACGGGDALSSPSSPSAFASSESLSMRVQTAHFQVFGGTTPDATLRAAADRLEAEYPRILSDLGVATFPMVTVRIWQDATSYYSELTRYFGVRYPATGYITGPAELRLLDGGNVTTRTRRSYQLGFVLGELVVSRYGRSSFLRLIETSAALQGVLGVSNAEFGAAWQSYVRQRYLSSVQSVSSVDYLS